MSAEKAKEFWGRSIWHTFHIISATYDPKYASSYLCFLSSLKDLLPCEVCRKHFKDILKEYPPDNYLSNNNDTFWYSYLIHDLVNQRLGKKSPNFDSIKRHYFSSLGSDCQRCKLPN